jgi:hypothetical protein
MNELVAKGKAKNVAVVLVGEEKETALCFLPKSIHRCPQYQYKCCLHPNGSEMKWTGQDGTGGGINRKRMEDHWKRKG